MRRTRGAKPKRSYNEAVLGDDTLVEERPSKSSRLTRSPPTKKARPPRLSARREEQFQLMGNEGGQGSSGAVRGEEQVQLMGHVGGEGSSGAVRGEEQVQLMGHVGAEAIQADSDKRAETNEAESDDSDHTGESGDYIPEEEPDDVVQDEATGVQQEEVDDLMPKDQDGGAAPKEKVTGKKGSKKAAAKDNKQSKTVRKKQPAKAKAETFTHDPQLEARVKLTLGKGFQSLLSSILHYYEGQDDSNDGLPRAFEAVAQIMSMLTTHPAEIVQQGGFTALVDDEVVDEGADGEGNEPANGGADEA